MSMAIKYGMQKRAKAAGACSAHGAQDCGECMAEGGQVHEKLDYTELKPGDRKGQSRAGVEVREAKRQRGYGDADSESRAKRAEGRAKDEHHAVLHDLKESGKKDRKNLADGGYVDDEPHPTSTATIDQDKADKAAKSMRDAFHFADGGVVDRIMKSRKGESADEQPNDFENPIDVPDDADYTAENSGDNLGNEALDENDADLIRRIMRSRAKKDSNPRPA